MAGRFAAARIIGRRALSARISEFLIGRDDGRALPPTRAGAHVELRFGGAGGVRFLRHYSLVGPLGRDTASEGFWRIAVQREPRGRGSDYLHRQMQPGSLLQISAAQAPFRLGSTPGPVLLVAGGIGITAMLPMLRSCVLRGITVRMAYAGRSRAAMAYLDEVVAIGGPCTQIIAEDEAGRPDFAAILAAQPTATTVYTCGPAPMMAAIEAAAAGLGWAPERLRKEVFNAAHHPEDRAFEVETRDGRRIAVPAGMTILDALEAARIDTLSDCRRGECGLCITPLAAPVPLDHRDRFLTEAQHRAMTQIALCCSRPAGSCIALDI